MKPTRRLLLIAFAFVPLVLPCNLTAQGESPQISRPLAPVSSAEVVSSAPTPQHQWIAAGWSWQDGHYAWLAGHWEVPPVAGAAWTPSRWEQRGSGFVLVNGSWATTIAPPSPAPDSAPPPQSATVAITIGAPQAPPPPGSDVVDQRPGPGYIWTPGFWSWTNGQYIWTSGRWTMPPQPGLRWVEPRWEQRGSEYVFVPGYWAGASPETTVPINPAPPPAPASVSVEVGPPGPPPAGPPELYVRAGPPPPRREYIGPRPSPYHIWVNGYWRWRANRYVWMDGHWELPPRGRVWVEPRWEHRDNGYVFIEGAWR